MARDAIKSALPGFRHSVDWWGLPTRLEWALAPDRGALGYQTGSLAARMAFGRLRGPWVQELKSLPLLPIGVQGWADSGAPHPAGFTWDDDLGTVVPSRLPTMLWALTRGAYTSRPHACGESGVCVYRF